MLLTVKEVAKELRTSTHTVYKLIKSGLLKTIKLGQLKVRKETLEKFLEEMDGKDVDKILEVKMNEAN